MIMEFSKKKRVKNIIKEIKRYLMFDLSNYEYGYGAYSSSNDFEEYEIAGRYLRLKENYIIKYIGDYKLKICGPIPMKKPIPGISIVTRLLVAIFGLILGITWVFAFLISIFFTILEYPLWWIVTGNILEDEHTILSYLFIATEESIAWILTELKLHRLLEIK